MEMRGFVSDIAPPIDYARAVFDCLIITANVKFRSVAGNTTNLQRLLNAICNKIKTFA